MSVFQTADGRWIVGGERSGSEYKGFLGWRDCVIQLTESGATERSIDYLNAFRDYALEHSKLGEPIMPPSVQIWISNNGATSAVQADDMSVDGNDFTICGIKWNGTSWDYSGAGQGSGGGGEGGGSGEGSLIVNITPVSGTEARADKTWGEIQTAFDSGRPVFMNLQQLGHCPVYLCANQNGAYGLRYFVYNSASITAANALVVNEGATADDYPVITSGGGGGGNG